MNEKVIHYASGILAALMEDRGLLHGEIQDHAENVVLEGGDNALMDRMVSLMKQIYLLRT